MSLSIADAVSMDPAPTPTTVTSSDRSVFRVITFNVPFTANGEPLTKNYEIANSFAHTTAGSNTLVVG
jgi:hypothetical protein